MQALRQIEATIDSVISVLSNSIPGFGTASSGTTDPQVSIGLESQMLCSNKELEMGMRV